MNASKVLKHARWIVVMTFVKPTRQEKMVSKYEKNASTVFTGTQQSTHLIKII